MKFQNHFAPTRANMQGDLVELLTMQKMKKICMAFYVELRVQDKTENNEYICECLGGCCTSYPGTYLKSK